MLKRISVYREDKVDYVLQVVGVGKRNSFLRRVRAPLWHKLTSLIMKEDEDDNDDNNTILPLIKIRNGFKIGLPDGHQTKSKNRGYYPFTIKREWITLYFYYKNRQVWAACASEFKDRTGVKIEIGTTSGSVRVVTDGFKMTFGKLVLQ